MAFYDEPERKVKHWAANIGIHTFKVVKDSIPLVVRARNMRDAKRKAMQYLIVAKVSKNIDEVA